MWLNIDTPDNAGFTPLMNACLCNDLIAVEYLIDNGAALDQQFEGGASAGNTALVNMVSNFFNY